MLTDIDAQQQCHTLPLCSFPCITADEFLTRALQQIPHHHWRQRHFQQIKPQIR